jgi:hypothetical protein
MLLRTGITARQNKKQFIVNSWPGPAIISTIRGGPVFDQYFIKK